MQWSAYGKKNENFVAPRIDYLLACLGRDYRNPSKTSQKLKDEIEKIFSAAKEIQPIKNNSEAKVIWIRVPRGEITNFGNYEEIELYGSKIEWLPLVIS